MCLQIQLKILEQYLRPHNSLFQFFNFELDFGFQISSFELDFEFRIGF